MASPTRSIKRAIGFGVALLIITLWQWLPVIRAIARGKLFAELYLSNALAILMALTVQSFLLYRFLASLRLLSRHTDRLDLLFYQDKKGSLAITILGVVWGLCSLAMVGMTGLDLMFPGGTMFSPLGDKGAFLEFVCGILSLISPFMFMGLTVWFFMTAAKGIWRVTAPREGRGDEEMPLGREEAVDDEWDEWKDNRG